MRKCLTSRVLGGDKDENADTDQNAETTIWSVYGTGSNKSPNGFHLLENLKLLQTVFIFPL